MRASETINGSIIKFGSLELSQGKKISLASQISNKLVPINLPPVAPGPRIITDGNLEESVLRIPNDQNNQTMQSTLYQENPIQNRGHNLIS